MPATLLAAGGIFIYLSAGPLSLQSPHPTQLQRATSLCRWCNDILSAGLCQMLAPTVPARLRHHPSTILIIVPIIVIIVFVTVNASCICQEQILPLPTSHLPISDIRLLSSSRLLPPNSSHRTRIIFKQTFARSFGRSVLSSGCSGCLFLFLAVFVAGLVALVKCLLLFVCFCCLFWCATCWLRRCQQLFLVTVTGLGIWLLSFSQPANQHHRYICSCFLSR